MKGKNKKKEPGVGASSLLEVQGKLEKEIASVKAQGESNVDQNILGSIELKESIVAKCKDILTAFAFFALVNNPAISAETEQGSSFRKNLRDVIDSIETTVIIPSGSIEAAEAIIAKFAKRRKNADATGPSKRPRRAKASGT